MANELTKIQSVIKNLFSDLTYEEIVASIPAEIIERIQKDYMRTRHRENIRKWKYGNPDTVLKRGRKPVLASMTEDEKRERQKQYRANYARKTKERNQELLEIQKKYEELEKRVASTESSSLQPVEQDETTQPVSALSSSGCVAPL